MQTFPSLPEFKENKIEITNFVDFEIEAKGQKFLVVFEMKMDVTFDKELNEVIIDCTQERIDNFNQNIE